MQTFKYELTPEQLFDKIILLQEEMLPDMKMAEIHKAVLMEACENAINGKSDEPLSESMLMLVAVRALEVSIEMLKGLILGAIQGFNGDTVNLNYRDQTFHFDRNTPFVKQALEEKNKS